MLTTLRYLIVSISGVIIPLSPASTPVIHWSLNNGPPSGVNELRFPLLFSLTPDASGLFFAFYAPLTGGSAPYTGFKPVVADKSGLHAIQAIFSTYNETARTKNGNCVNGAYSGIGISCSVRFQIKTGNFYSNRLTVRVLNNDLYLYSGDVYDDRTNLKVAKIGSFTLPASAGAGLFRPDGTGFIEAYYPVGCSQSVNATYGEVTGFQGSNKYSGVPIEGSLPAYGNCINALFRPSTLPENIDVNITASLTFP